MHTEEILTLIAVGQFLVTTTIVVVLGIRNHWKWIFRTEAKQASRWPRSRANYSSDSS